jgi:hypothetical protein
VTVRVYFKGEPLDLIVDTRLGTVTLPSGELFRVCW